MKRYAAAIPALFAAVILSAQNLNPTVEVTNVYSSSAKDIGKPVQEMAVPDSVTTFNLKLDYSVFDSPYKGAYEFTPYSTADGPAVKDLDRQQFYLRAGIGYSLHPEFEAVWSPEFKYGVRLDAFARHQSFFGNYRGLKGVTINDGKRDVTRMIWDKSLSFGYDALTDVGAKASWAWKKGEVTATAAYTNLSGKDYMITRSLNGARIGATVRSIGTEKVRYAASVLWRYGSDWGRFNEETNHYHVVENRLDIKGDVAFPLSLGELYTKVDFSLESLKQGLNETGMILSATPGYRFAKGNWFFDLGVKVDGFVGDRERFKVQHVYPAVYVSYNIPSIDMTVYASATGGSRLNAYGDVVAATHVFNMNHYVVAGSRLLDNSVDRVRAMLGLRGNISHRFHYHLRGGYALVGNGLLDAMVLEDPLGNPFAGPMPATGYASFHVAFADMDCNWISDHVKADAHFKIDGAFPLKSHGGSGTAPFFLPALLTGSVKGGYIWNKVLTVGASVDFSTSRKSPFAADHWYKIPGYADLGIFAEYQINKLIGVWLKGGNLLHSTNQAIPLYTASGIYFTAGIVLTF